MWYNMLSQFVSVFHHSGLKVPEKANHGIWKRMETNNLQTLYWISRPWSRWSEMMVIDTNENEYEMEIWTPCQKSQIMSSKRETDYSIPSPRFSFPRPHCASESGISDVREPLARAKSANACSPPPSISMGFTFVCSTCKQYNCSGILPITFKLCAFQITNLTVKFGSICS